MGLCYSQICSIAKRRRIPSARSNKLEGTVRISGVVGSVWEWVAESIRSSPRQLIANLGLGLGQDNPPPFLTDAHKKALEKVECNQYAPTSGLPSLKEALSKVYSPLYKRQLNAETEISIHSGGTEAILSVITAFVEVGDEVVVMEPAFDLYELHTRFVGGKLKPVRLHPPVHAASTISKADEWRLDLKELEDAMTPRTRVLVLNTPHNPLGKVFSVEELLAVGGLCVKYNVVILSDEVYERLFYTPTFPRIATLRADIARQTITIGSIGKAFNATGWRLGYAIGDESLIRHVQNAHIILSYTTAGPAQWAAGVAIQAAEYNSFYEDNRVKVKRKLDDLCTTFRELDLPYVEPSGAHYLFVNLGKVRLPQSYHFPLELNTKSRDWKLAWFLIQEFGVAAIPASASFVNANAHVAEDYLRFVACKSDVEIALAKQRLKGLARYL